MKRNIILEYFQNTHVINEDIIENLKRLNIYNNNIIKKQKINKFNTESPNIKLCNNFLNKISPKNYLALTKEINKINIEENEKNEIIKRIINKGILDGLHYNYIIINSFKSIIFQNNEFYIILGEKIAEFFNYITNVNYFKNYKLEHKHDELEYLDYETKQKTHYRNLISFIGSLYYNNMLNIDLVKKILKNLVNLINKTEYFDNQIEMIICLHVLLKSFEHNHNINIKKYKTIKFENIENLYVFLKEIKNNIKDLNNFKGIKKFKLIEIFETIDKLVF